MPLNGPVSILLLLALWVSTRVARGKLPDYPMTIDEMKVDAGYYTASGKYLGGIPSWADTVRRGIYDCVDDDYFYTTGDDTNANATAATNEGYATACMEWSEDESAGSTFKLGSCECRAVENEAYCSAWICEVKKATNCKADGIHCSTSTAPDPALCECDIESSSGLYCNSWSCKQIDSKGRDKFGEHHCQRESASGHFCEAWNGNVTVEHKIEVTRCECVAMWNGDRVCSHWECEELDLVICGSPDGDWSCHLSMSIGVGGGFGLFGIVMMGSFINLVRRVGRTHGLCDFFPVVLFFVGLFIACFICVLVWGGVDGATIVGIIWGTGLLVIIAAAFCCNLEEPTVAHARGGDYEMVQPTSAHKRTVDSS